MKTRRPEPTTRLRLDGLARRSCTWADMLGPGYATGPSSRMIEHVGAAARRGYCR